MARPDRPRGDSTPGDKVFLVDDDPSVLRGLGRLLRSAGYDVETFASPHDFLAQPPHVGPSCAVLDVRMPDLDGIKLLEALSQMEGAPPVVFITGHGDVPTTARAMKGGAIDFLCKPVDETELLSAIDQALQRDAEARAKRAEQHELKALLDTLTPREREVCEHVAQGLLNKQIGDVLGISEKTVKVHRERVMRKLRVSSVAQLVRLVVRASTTGTT